MIKNYLNWCFGCVRVPFWILLALAEFGTFGVCWYLCALGRWKELAESIEES